MILETVQHAPNPQFARFPWHDLTGTWAFAYDDDDVGMREGWFEDPSYLDATIEVPYPPESQLSGINDTGFHPIVWYQRDIDDTRSDPDMRLYLCFGAVDYHAIVWVNGRWVGEHSGGSTPFSLDITDALGEEDVHSVTVRAFDHPTDIEQPRGKQAYTLEPEIIHYYRTTGIWQPVWLEERPAIHVTSIRWTFDRLRWMLGFEAELSSQPAEDTLLSIELEDDGLPYTGVTTSASGRHVQGSIDLRSLPRHEDRLRLLWSPGSPRLIGASITLSSTSAPDDSVLSYVGLRTVETTQTAILINGHRTFLRLVLNQGYWPESHLAAPTPAHLRREVQHILDLGFNGARNHQKIEDPRFLFWADKLGLLLWGEIGAAFEWSDRAIERHASEWRETVRRDRNHPSIIAWVPFNESWGVDDVFASTQQQHAVSAAWHATKALDGTRPVVGNDGWDHVDTDILTPHDYNWDPEHLTNRYGSDVTPQQVIERYHLGNHRLVVGDHDHTDKPIVLSEYGGVSFAPSDDEQWFGYGRVGSTDQFIEKYRSLTERLHDSSRLAGFCYTQLTDTEQETNGLLFEDRTPKVDIETLRKITMGPAYQPRKHVEQDELDDGTPEPDVN